MPFIEKNNTIYVPNHDLKNINHLKMAEFLNIDMSLIKNEYEMFDLGNKNFSERRDH